MSGDVVERLRGIIRDDDDEAILVDNYITLAEAASEIEALRKQRDDAEDAENQAKDAFWAIYHDYLERGGSPVSTEAARTALATRAETAERLLAEARAALEPFAKVTKNITQNFDDAAIVSVGIDFTLSPEDVASIEAHPRGGKLSSNRSTLIVSLDGINAGHFRTAARTLTNGGENGR